MKKYEVFKSWLEEAGIETKLLKPDEYADGLEIKNGIATFSVYGGYFGFVSYITFDIEKDVLVKIEAFE